MQSTIRLSVACLTGLVVKASASRAADLGSVPAFAVDFLQSSHASDLEIGTPVATLPPVKFACRRVNQIPVTTTAVSI